MTEIERIRYETQAICWCGGPHHHEDHKKETR